MSYSSIARWLSRGNVLSRMFELWRKIYVFLKEGWHKNVKEFSDQGFLIKLAYLCDIFDKLNALSIYLQAKNMHLLKFMEEILTFIKKLKLWRIKMNEETSKNSFSILRQFLIYSRLEIPQDIKSIFKDHLSQLIIWCENYF